jgi:hypothetical protein
MSTPSDSAAFTQLYDDLAAELLRYLWRRCGDRAQAEDLVSVVFLEAWRRRSTLRPGAPARPWLYRAQLRGGGGCAGRPRRDRALAPVTGRAGASATSRTHP